MHFLILILIALVVPSLSFGAEKPVEIFLMIGQSNMAGRAGITPEIAGELEGALLLNDKGGWEPLTNPLNRYSTIRKGLGMQKLGPGYGFAKELITQRPDIMVGLVVNARGGSKIDEWAEGGRFFKEAVARTQLAVAAGGKLKGICWHQGESNAEDKAYMEKLTALVGAFRKALGDEKLPFVVGETCKAKAERPVNVFLRQLPKDVPNSACASADGLKALDGNTHFDTASQLELGKRYAKEMSRLLK